jgi:glyoxylase-like metal-dependent hydrolase (beta-lactamase superfamily II)
MKLLAVLALAAATLLGQGTDYSQVQIKTTKVSNNFYTLEGSGGMIGVLVGPDGVFMVDTQFAPLSEKIVAAIKAITPQPIKFVVNTHQHPDHTGGNENFAKLGATLLSRDQLRYRLAHPAPGANGAPGTPAPALALPAMTYDGPVTLHMNGEDIELIPVRNAHTDGDTMVRFVKNDVLMVGDFFRSIQFPNIDRNNGGSFNGMLAGLGMVIGSAGPATKIIPGHGPTVDRTAATAHRDLMLAVRDRIAPLVQQGKTLPEVVASKPLGTYETSVKEPGTTGERFIGQVYAELQAAK